MRVSKLSRALAVLFLFAILACLYFLLMAIWREGIEFFTWQGIVISGLVAYVAIPIVGTAISGRVPPFFPFNLKWGDRIDISVTRSE